MMCVHTKFEMKQVTQQKRQAWPKCETEKQVTQPPLHGAVLKRTGRWIIQCGNGIVVGIPGCDGCRNRLVFGTTVDVFGCVVWNRCTVVALCDVVVFIRRRKQRSHLWFPPTGTPHPKPCQMETSLCALVVGVRNVVVVLLHDAIPGIWINWNVVRRIIGMSNIWMVCVHLWGGSIVRRMAVAVVAEAVVLLLLLLLLWMHHVFFTHTTQWSDTTHVTKKDRMFFSTKKTKRWKNKYKKNQGRK